MDRRTFIYSATVFGAAGAGLLRPVPALATPWPAPAFRRRAAPDEILNVLYGTTDAQSSDAITLKAPINAADGANVPVEIATTLPDVESIALISSKNPVPLITRLRLHGAAPWYSIRVKLGETTRLSAYARSRGHTFVASTDVKVTVGGCGDAVHEKEPGNAPSYLTRMRVRSKNDRVETLVLVKHPMETGARKDGKTGRAIPEHFIQTMTFSRNGAVIAEADMGVGVARNPLIGIAFPDAGRGDRIEMRWVDNHGNTGSADNVVS